MGEPKLKIRGLGWDEVDEIHDFDQARYLPYGQNVIVAVEGVVVLTHDEFLDVAAANPGQDELLVEITPILVGG